MTSEQVKVLQRALDKLGFAVPAEEDCIPIFGEGTLQSVQEFQKKHKLEPNAVNQSTLLGWCWSVENSCAARSTDW